MFGRSVGIVVVGDGWVLSLGMGAVTDFETLAGELRPRLARAFVAAYGPERGQEALAESMAWAWENFEDLRSMDNPAGYLYRVGQSRTRPRRTPPVFPAPEVVGVPWVEPALPDALLGLSENQRVSVFLVHAYGWTYREVGDLLDLAPTTIQNHVERGLAHLRRLLEVVPDA